MGRGGEGFVKYCLNKNILILKSQTHKFLLCYMPGVQKKLTSMTSFVLYRLCLSNKLYTGCLFPGGSLLLRCFIRKKVVYKGGDAFSQRVLLTTKTSRNEMLFCVAFLC